MKTFSFEHQYQFDEKEFTQLNYLFSRKTKWYRYLLVVLVGLLLLFTKYTLLLGVFLLALSSLRFFAPKLQKFGAHTTWEDLEYIKRKLTYGLSNEGLWVIDKHFNCNLNWAHAKVWEEKMGWLRIAAYHCPTFWFKISDLKENNIYKEVISLCELNAVKYK